MGEAPPPDAAAPPTRVRYLVLAWLCSAALVAYIHRNAISVAVGNVRDSLGLDEAQMGDAMGAFFLTYALFQLPAGWLSHRWGTRRALTLFAVLWSAATLLTAAVGGFAGLLATRLAAGAAQAGIFTCTTQTVAHWFPAAGRALPSGCLGASMSVGGALATALTGLLLPHLDWRWLFVVYGAPGFLWAAWFYGWFRDRPREHPAANAAERALAGEAAPAAGGPREPIPWAALLTSPAMGWICAQQFFRAAGYIFFATWFPEFLKQTRGVSTSASGLLTSLPLLGVVLGSVAGGAASDWLLARTGSRRVARQWLSVVSLAVCAACIGLAYPVADALGAVLLISAGSFFASLAAPCAYTITIDMGGKHVPTVFSLMNMSGNLGALLFPVVAGRLVKFTGNWDLVLFVFLGIYVAAGACWAMLNPDGTIFDRPGGLRRPGRPLWGSNPCRTSIRRRAAAASAWPAATSLRRRASTTACGAPPPTTAPPASTAR